MTTQEFKKQALELLDNIEPDDFRETRVRTVDSIKLKQLHKLIESQPDEPKPKPSKSLDVVAKDLVEKLKDECSFGGIPDY